MIPIIKANPISSPNRLLNEAMVFFVLATIIATSLKLLFLKFKNQNNG